MNSQQTIPPESGKWKLRFWSIFGGQALSLVGSALTQFVLLWWITDTTGSVSALATAGVAALLPQALLSPLGGTLADRYSRRLIMIAADLISAACMSVLIALFLSDNIQMWHVYTMMFIRSSMQAFQAPAAAASMAMLVPVSFLPRAAGMNQTLQSFTLVAAAPLGALAMSFMPLGWALSIDVSTAILGVSPLLFYHIPQIIKSKEERENMWTEFREGMHLVWNSPGLRRLYALLGAVVLVIMPSFTLVPLLVKEYFMGAAPQVAIMESVAGIGMMAGGIIVAVLVPKRLILWILWGFVVSCFAMALTAVVPGNMFWLALTWWGISGITFAMANAPLTTLLQTTIPNEMQGRVLSLLSMIMGLAAPVGLAIATPLGEITGVRWLFVIIGTLGGLVSLAGFISPSLLQLGQQNISANPAQIKLNEHA